MRRLGKAVIAVVTLCVLTACQVHAQVAIDVDKDGSGTVTVIVTLDSVAAKSLGNPVEAVKVDDLSDAGWKVRTPVIDNASGAVTFVASRNFDSPDQLGAVMSEIGGSGPSGVFADTKLTIDDGFASTRYRFSSRVRLSGSVEQFSDEALKGALGGFPLGRSAKDLRSEGLADLDAVVVDISVKLPGGSPVTKAKVDEGAARWSFAANSESPTNVAIDSESTQSDRLPRVLIVAGAVLLLAALVVGGVGARQAIERSRSV